MKINEKKLPKYVIGSSETWISLINCCLSPCFCGFALGFNYGNIGGVLSAQSFQEYYNYPSTTMIEALAAILMIGSVLGSFLGGYISDRYGRKTSIIFAACLMTIGDLFISLSIFFSVVPILVGRFCIGIAGGTAGATIPMYVSEITIAKYRGSVESTYQFAIVSGMLVAFLLNWQIVPTYRYGWYVSLAAGLIPALIFLFLSNFLIESPRWLIVFSDNNDHEQAMIALQKLRTPKDDVQNELMGIINERDQQQIVDVTWKEVFNSKNRWNSFVAIVTYMGQSATGIDILTYYTPEIFGSISGKTSETDNLFSTIFAGLVLTLVTPIAIATIDIIGRRKLLLIGSVGMVISLACLTISYWFFEHGSTNYAGMVAFVSILFYCAFYTSSFGTVPFSVAPEMVNSRIRAKVVALGAGCTWALDYVMIATFLSLMDAVGHVGVFAIYTGLNIIALFFVLTCIRETKGIELEAIHANEECIPLQLEGIHLKGSRAESEKMIPLKKITIHQKSYGTYSSNTEENELLSSWKISRKLFFWFPDLVKFEKRIREAF